MSKINYKNLEEITVKSQKKLDDIPEDFEGRIYIEFGTYYNPAIIRKKYCRRVVACDNSSVEARDNSSVVAYNNSSVVAYNNSSVEACGNSSVVACDNSSVEAQGNTQVVESRYFKGKIQICGNARKVYLPRNINEFMDYYGVEHTKTHAFLYKAVHKKEGEYLADYDKNFTYKIGKSKKEICDQNVERGCSKGINIAHLNWALNFGKNWEDLAILKVKTKTKDIVMPIETDGKVRTSEIKVVEEVPLEECGVYGKILAKRRLIND